MELLCGGCGKTLTVDDSRAGGQVRCPACGRVLQVPRLDEVSVEPEGGLLVPLAEEEEFADEFLTKARLALKRKMLVVCGSCGQRLTVEQRLAGKVGRCPACGERIQVPAQDYEGPEPRPGPSEQREQQVEEVLDVHRPARRAAGGPGVPQEGGVPRELVRAARAEALRRLRRGPVPSLRVVTLTCALSLAVGAAGGLMVGYFLWAGTSANPVGTGVPPDGATGTPAGPAARARVPSPSNPRSMLPTPATSRGPRHVASASSPAPAAVSVLERRLDVLGGGGLVPAPLGKAFLTVSLALRAGREALRLDPRDGSVWLESGGRRILPEGFAPSGRSVVPGVADEGVLTLAPGRSGRARVVFLVPVDAAGGVLGVRGVGEAGVNAVEPAKSPAREALAGSYAEAGRRLRLGFADPVMEAVRSSPLHELVVTAEGDAFALSLPPTEVRGEARFLRPGEYAATLRSGTSRLACRLRLLAGARRVILYLADQPFHQVIYRRRSGASAGALRGGGPSGPPSRSTMGRHE